MKRTILLIAILALVTFASCQKAERPMPVAYDYDAYDGYAHFSVQVRADGGLPQFWGDEMSWRLGMALANPVTSLTIKGMLTGTITRSCVLNEFYRYYEIQYILRLNGAESRSEIRRSEKCELFPMASVPELEAMTKDVVAQLIAKLPPLTLTVFASDGAPPPAGSAERLRKKLQAALAGKGIKGHYSGTLMYTPAGGYGHHAERNGDPEDWLLGIDDDGHHDDRDLDNRHWLISKQGGEKEAVDPLVTEMASQISQAH